MTGPDTSLESPFWAEGKRVAGVDEVGRGPLAGPVVAAAVILDPALIPAGLNDSKKLTLKRREALEPIIRAQAMVGLGVASVEEIDEINILQATYLAMRRAVAALPQKPDHLLIDGNRLPTDLPCPATPVVKGDGKSVSISAASIIAKTWRDALMRDLAQHHPGYGWETNAGYGSKSHMQALRDFGVTPHHRRSFAPIHNILYQDGNVRS
ncbi:MULTISPECIES: ribonuclease HII [Roseobacteraceae]|uniref:ribonuclease HII n=1 Tax=Roseobacteraceae TaxID=2854170 RepID=UPI00080AA330|nr:MULTISPECIES: ribonuclease HII [Roseobacteraceae]ANT59898.1 ribonuclease HII [Salipiger sp. CCB-MM3]MCA0997937.1 ribonuclease HII [Alloyangia pacifica]NDW01709.1 ribonuclease HII [Salipiger sp. PrR002]NDW59205.1 ribonuclease HII [Salipiger sp. PrR004]